MSSVADELSVIVGARVDAAHANPDTGLVAIAIYAGEKRALGAGIGPHVAGLGWLPRLPRVRASVNHPLVAAMRAHLVGHRVRDVLVDDDGIVWLVVAGPEGGLARLALAPYRKGEARVIAATGELVVRWPPAPASGVGGSGGGALSLDLQSVGAALVEESDRIAAVRAKTALARALKARVQAMERRADAVRGDLERLSGIDHLQKIGRLLLAQGAKVPRGADRVTLNDWEAGGSIEVTLDPAKPAKAQAETFFAKARRFQRGEVVMRRRLEETESAVSALRDLAALVAEAPADLQSLEPLAARARSLGVTDAPDTSPAASASGRSARQARSAERRPYNLFRSAGGSPILVGRGGKDNDALTTKHARPHDLWLHAKGMAGAHVIVPLEKGTSCPPDVLVDAATLAAHFSDARGEAVCDVSYVERRYVRKPRKSAPGAVTFDREKIMAVRIEPGRLTRLLASKEEA